MGVFGYMVVVWFFFFENFNGLHGELLRFPRLKLFGDIQDVLKISKFLNELNITVSKWLSRYVYIPTLKKGGSRLRALVCTMLVSMVFHELCAFYILGFILLHVLLLDGVVLPMCLLLDRQNKIL